MLIVIGLVFVLMIINSKDYLKYGLRMGNINEVLSPLRTCHSVRKRVSNQLWMLLRTKLVGQTRRMLSFTLFLSGWNTRNPILKGSMKTIRTFSCSLSKLNTYYLFFQQIKPTANMLNIIVKQKSKAPIVSAQLKQLLP